MTRRTPFGPRLNLMLPLAILLLAGGCGRSEAEEKARKEVAFRHFNTLIERNRNLNTGNLITGRSTSGPEHPGFIREPRPTHEQVELGAGKADYSRRDSEGLLLVWWEPDPSSAMWTPEGDRKGVHAYLRARFDQKGRLESIDAMYGISAEHFDRSVSGWKWRGP